MDRSKWPQGPWSEEPDRESWVDETTGFQCLIQRHPEMGHLCGYIAVDATHPWHDKHYECIHADVHGDLTYAGHKRLDNPESELWYIGFDCAHAGDVVPNLLASYPQWMLHLRDEEYRDWAYVRLEVLSLARQAKDALVKAALADQVPVHGN